MQSIGSTSSPVFTLTLLRADSVGDNGRARFCSVGVAMGMV